MPQLDAFQSELLSAYIDKELDSNELKIVTELLATSSECREELERLRVAKTVTAAAPTVAIPADLLESLQQAAREVEPSGQKWWQFPRSWMMATSFATASILMAVWVGHRVQSGRHETLELEMLIAVHQRQQVDLSTHQGVMAAANYSAQLRNTTNDPI